MAVFKCDLCKVLDEAGLDTVVISTACVSEQIFIIVLLVKHVPDKRHTVQSVFLCAYEGVYLRDYFHTFYDFVLL